MNSRERVLGVLNRKPVDRIPVDLWYTPEILAALMAHCGVDNEIALFRALKLDKICWISNEYRGARPPVGENEIVTEWGSVLKRQQAGAANYDEAARPALAHCESAAEVEAFPWWPKPEDYSIEPAIERVLKMGSEFITLGPWVSFFEIYCNMRGLENAMMDLVADPDMVTVALDRIEAIQLAHVTRLYDTLQARGVQVDASFMSDDMGSQQGLLMSLKHWERYIAPRLARWCDFVHGYGMKVFFHSDGACAPLIPRLIECGIDVLNPIQHVCPGMDRAELKAKYGEKLIFHGGVENQSILPFGTAEEVRAETRECLRTLGAGGAGYIACSCHNVQPGTPVENVLAMIETVLESGGITAGV
jgi:uroporphyrinogen decarboxylase